MTRGLTWGLKRSFRDYVAGIDDGRETAEEGARIEARGFFFPLADEGEALCFSGRVALSGYNGLLELRIEDPWVERDGEGWVLSIVDPTSRSLPRQRLPLAVLSEPVIADDGREGRVLRALDARLAPTGARLFDGVYAPGTPLEQVELAGVELPSETTVASRG